MERISFNNVKLIDLTRLISHQMPAFPNDPSVQLHTVASIDNGGFSNSLLSMGMHSGTHIDGPSHFFENRELMSDMSIDRFVGDTVVIDARGALEVDLSPQIKSLPLFNKIVLICTGFDNSFGQDSYFTKHPIITQNLAQYFADQRIKMLGIDMPSPDNAPYSVHSLLLGLNIPIIENLIRLDALLPFNSIQLFALPLKIEADSAPARVIAIVSNK